MRMLTFQPERRRLGFATAMVVFGISCGRPAPSPMPEPDPGISQTLADERARTVRNLRYALSFDIPRTVVEPIVGHALLRFTLDEPRRPLVLDFAPGLEQVTSVTIQGRASPLHAVNGHLVIPPDHLAAGDNAIEIVFRAGDAALNRQSEFLYTLFVPARAHLAFPCFDQPDVKARYSLELTLPGDWQAVVVVSTVALDDVINQPLTHTGPNAPGEPIKRCATDCHKGGSPAGGFDWENVWFDTDLRKQHPISIQYDAARNANFQPAAAVEAAGLKLEDGRVQCNTCHDPHTQQNRKFMRIPNSAGSLCLVCHRTPPSRSTAHFW